MRTPRITLWTLVLLSTCASPGPAGTPWSRTYGGPSKWEGVLRVVEDAGGDLLVGGQTDSFPPHNGWLLRLDAAGNVLSERAYGRPTQTGGTSAIAPAPDGGALLAGRIVLDLMWIHHGWISRVDPSGTVLWTTRFYTPPFPTGWGRYFLDGLLWTGDGGVLGAGSTAVTDGEPPWAWIVRLDEGGALLWQYKYRDAAEEVRAVVEAGDGGYVVAGRTASGGATAGDVWIMKVDRDGAVQWQKRIGGTLEEEAASLVRVADGGYALAGWTNSYTASGHAALALRLDSAGNLLWHKVLGDEEWSDFQGVVETADGNLVFVGRVGEPGAPSNDLWVVKMRSDDGTVLWQRAYTGHKGDWGETALQLADGDLLVGGTWAAGFPEEEMWLLRLDRDGLIPSCNRIRETIAAALSPRIDVGDGSAEPAAPEAFTRTDTIGSADTLAIVRSQCESPSCPDLICDDILLDPGHFVCEGTPQAFTVLTRGGVEPLLADWDWDGDTVPDASGNPADLTLPVGAWDVTGTVTDSCADPEPHTCSLTETAIVRPNPDPEIRPLGPTEFCAELGESVVLETQTGSARYQWFLDGAEIPGAMSHRHMATVSGDYTVRATDSDGCEGTSPPVTVNADACPCEPLACDAVDVSPEPAVCVGTAQTFLLTTSGGRGPVTVQWDLDGDTTPDDSGNPVTVTLPAGDRTVRAMASDSCSDPEPQTCSMSLPVSVHPDPTPMILPEEPPKFCAKLGESTLLEVEPGYATYQWFLDGAEIPGAVSHQHVAVASGLHTVTVTDSIGCEGTSAPVPVYADHCPCEVLSCEGVTVDADPVCQGVSQTFSALLAGGEGDLAFEWDFDGDTTPDAVGNPAAATLPEGQRLVTVAVTDSCEDPAPQTCSAEILVTVLSSTRPGEVSDPSAGAPPLRVRKEPSRLVLENVAGAVAYNVYADALGSWYFPTTARGSLCAIQDWTDNGDGTLTIEAPLPKNSWVLLTASTACAEGPAGGSSDGTERTNVGDWERCEAAP